MNKHALHGAMLAAKRRIRALALDLLLKRIDLLEGCDGIVALYRSFQETSDDRRPDMFLVIRGVSSEADDIPPLDGSVDLGLEFRALSRERKLKLTESYEAAVREACEALLVDCEW